MGEGTYLSHEGYDKLKKELEYLKKVKRRELSKEIGVARAHGDLRENAEYKAAKEAQALNEERVAKLENKLSEAQILDDSKIAKDEALIGATVKMNNVDTKESVEYTLVSELEADFSQGKISIDSPIGKALLGHKKNDIVKVEVPAGLLKFKILKISR
ncbi:MAG: transcription elongation factor GreA [Candidatus Omnitrophica bacterium]|nr:transcription elongation factor GreA [Candidatus Omnitrophota bacterium]